MIMYGVLGRQAFTNRARNEIAADGSKCPDSIYLEQASKRPNNCSKSIDYKGGNEKNGGNCGMLFGPRFGAVDLSNELFAKVNW